MTLKLLLFIHFLLHHPRHQLAIIVEDAITGVDLPRPEHHLVECFIELADHRLLDLADDLHHQLDTLLEERTGFIVVVSGGTLFLFFLYSHF